MLRATVPFCLLLLVQFSVSFTIRDLPTSLSNPSSAKMTLLEVKKLNYKYTPSTPLDNASLQDDAVCECNCHVSNAASAQPFECFCVCPRQHGGQKGTIGLDGLKGEMGVRGKVGEVGPKGDVGLQGPSGPRGARGPKGDVGDEGDDGEDAIDGGDDVGPQGPPGPPGDVEPGMRGVVGPTGPRGPHGDEGERGFSSGVGEPGAIGVRGSKGRRGKQGDTGETGEVGVRGKVGPVGPDGPMAGGLDETSLYVKALAGSVCSASARNSKVSTFALYRSQDNLEVCGDTCATLCGKMGSTCKGGIFIPNAQQGNRPASTSGELGLLTYKFPTKVCETAGCDQANWCCCEEAGDEYKSGPMSLPGLSLWLSGDQIDRSDPAEVGKESMLASWSDFSGAGNSAKTVVLGAKPAPGSAAANLPGLAPRYELAKLNEKSLVRFGYKNDATGKYTETWMSLPSTFSFKKGQKGFTMLAVARPVGGVPNGALFEFGAGKGLLSFTLGADVSKKAYTIGGLITSEGGGRAVADVPFGLEPNYVIATYYVEYGKSMKVRLNPSQDSALDKWAATATLGPQLEWFEAQASKDGVPTADTGVASIGHPSAVNSGNGNSASFVGEIAEVLLYEEALNEKQIASVECYLSKKYSVGYCRT